MVSSVQKIEQLAAEAIHSKSLWDLEQGEKRTRERVSTTMWPLRMLRCLSPHHEICSKYVKGHVHIKTRGLNSVWSTF